MAYSKADRSGANASKLVAYYELTEPIPEPMTTCEIFRGIIIMTFAIFFLAASGIILKMHYQYNPKVTVND